METPGDLTAPEIIAWLESVPGEEWSRRTHMSHATFSMSWSGIASIKPMWDAGATRRMNLSDPGEDIYWHVGFPQRLVRIKPSRTPPENI
jgi:hypothetical protein